MCLCFICIQITGILLFYEWLPYHCVGGGYFNGWIPPPPLIGILNTLRLRVPSGLFNDKHACNVMGKYIVHLYVQLLYNSDENVKWQLIPERTKDRPILYWALLFLKGPLFLACNTRGKVYRKGNNKIRHYPVSWEYNMWDVVELPCDPCTW